MNKGHFSPSERYKAIEYLSETEHKEFARRLGIRLTERWFARIRAGHGPEADGDPNWVPPDVEIFDTILDECLSHDGRRRG